MSIHLISTSFLKLDVLTNLKRLYLELLSTKKYFALKLFNFMLCHSFIVGLSTLVQYQWRSVDRWRQRQNPRPLTSKKLWGPKNRSFLFALLIICYFVSPKLCAFAIILHPPQIKFCVWGGHPPPPRYTIVQYLVICD